MVAFQTTKPDPESILQSMIASFMFPGTREQSNEDIEAVIEQIAFANNARFRDPKTGKILGTYRDVKRGQKRQPPPKQNRRIPRMRRVVK